MFLADSARFNDPGAVRCTFHLRSRPRPVLRRLPDYRRTENFESQRRAKAVASPRLPPAPHRWLEQVYTLCADGKIDPAIDLVLDELDDLLYERNAERCNEILAAADVNRMSVEVLVSFLMETFRARAALPAREGFYDRARAKLQAEMPERAAKIFAHLS